MKELKQPMIIFVVTVLSIVAATYIMNKISEKKNTSETPKPTV